MKLSRLLAKIKHEILAGNPEDTEITSLVYDSRKAEKGSAFVCISGTLTDAHKYIPDVVEKGAAAVIVTKDCECPEGVCVVKVDDDREALALMSSAWFDYPSEKLTVIGITGTKGKTTTTYMVKNVLEHAGKTCGLIGTIETIIGDRHIPSSHSTPESYVVQEYFAEMVKAGIDTVIMEVSSQGLKMKRVAGIEFDYGVFTNLEPDHIGGNEHPDFADYLYCKSLLFRQCKTGLGNIDDSHFEEIMQNRTCRLISFGTNAEADYRAENIGLTKSGIKYTAVLKKPEGEKRLDVFVDIPGRFTVYNSLTALAICDLLGVSAEATLKGLSDVKVRGRVETVPVSDDYVIMVDYAHNEMSLRSVLTTLREYKPERLVCVFGCGGNRSKERRYTMGKVSGELADLTVITSDNPRFEEPKDIIADIVSSIEKVPGAKYEVVIDRYEAIKYCIENAKKGDLILVAGKGHEDYQEIKGVKYHMDDVEMIKQAAAYVAGKGQ